MHIIFDTSVWIRHFRQPEPELVDALINNRVLIHQAIIGELAVGSIPKYKTTLADLLQLTFAPIVDFEDLLMMIENKKLASKGLSWIDVQLLGSALLAKADLKTYDKILSANWNKVSKDSMLG